MLPCKFAFDDSSAFDGFARRRMIMAFRSIENGRLYRVPQTALASATITPRGDGQ